MADPNDPLTYREHWERNALNWAAFTRGPEPDAYPDFKERFFAFIPPPGRRTLEVGCGEGRVCRDLRDRGYAPIGIDASPTLLRLAREADPEGEYLEADAAALPFDDGAFDLVVAYNVLMDVDALDAAVAEISRVLDPPGRLAACVTHPVADAGRFAEPSADSPFVIDGSYLRSQPFLGTARRNGVDMTFAGWAHPIEAYFAAFEQVGLAVEALREVGATPDMVERDPGEARWLRIPNFLFLRARRIRA